jgi:class 3 adenylate cyclase
MPMTPGAATTPAVPSVPTGRILVVDDEPLNREMLLRRLARMGFNTTGAGNGQIALDIMAKEPFDLVLLDIMMPVMDGFETLDRLKADRKLRHIPVVMLTALDEVASTVRCIEAGAEDYVPKPFNPVILRARINASLEKKRLRDQERAFLAEIQAERAKSDRLLLNVLPTAIADRLKSGEQTIVDAVPEASVMFADIVGFTHIATTFTAARMVSLLNELFSEFDALSELKGLEKIKTIGDAYMVVGGVPLPVPDHAVRCAKMAFEMLNSMRRFNVRHQFNWQLRIGIHTGPLVAGIIGSIKFSYDLWGDTVNVASRLESHGEPDVPQVSEITANLLKDQFVLEARGEIELKNRGRLKTYRVLRPVGSGTRPPGGTRAPGGSRSPVPS